MQKSRETEQRIGALLLIAILLAIVTMIVLPIALTRTIDKEANAAATRKAKQMAVYEQLIADRAD